MRHRRHDHPDPGGPADRGAAGDPRNLSSDALRIITAPLLAAAVAAAGRGPQDPGTGRVAPGIGRCVT
nr:hypothetical protein OG461_07780 [Streptomyces sp. NBC_00995]